MRGPRVRIPSRLCVAVFLGALLLGLVHGGLAIVGAVWSSIPSFDDPVSRALEASASLTPPPADPFREASDQALARGAPAGRVPGIEGPPSRRGSSASSPPTRSPPA